MLALVARHQGITMRELARELGISERWVQQIVLQLVEAGYLSRRRSGRQNEYEVHTDLPMRHVLVRHCTVGRMIELLAGGPVGPTSEPHA